MQVTKVILNFQEATLKKMKSRKINFHMFYFPQYIYAKYDDGGQEEIQNEFGSVHGRQFRREKIFA